MDHPVSQWAGNIISAGAIISSALGWVPAFGALVGAVWYLIKIYESATVQHWVRQRRIRKIARLKARVLMMEAQDRPPLQLPKNFSDPT